ncbi:hypothetical protein ADIMK_2949 [Marinobacterium lacunae]|uniref:Uncharacterized protein n=2 Tax=Marinobacterium lacunae TaxID=1232683 RepID=A0A081FWD5_9GAMM|nr:hypothetical protein ADIMK_2949 [Marinobacterium lacunae]
MISNEKKEKSQIKVYVRMHDGTRSLGKVFLAEGERLQDIMNDDRIFIPVHVEEQKGTSLVMLAKRYIQQVEEVHSEAVKDEDFYARHGRRSGDRKVEPRVDPIISGMRLELD